MNIVKLLISVLFYSSVCTAQQIDTIKVKVHDHLMTLYVSGNGKPAVILEAGGSSNHRTWKLVQPKIAEDTKVVSYDRPGYLNSDSCPSARDAIRIATELKEALIKANIHPPYILSGWSYGGSLVRVFAGLYPKDVVGMVLVDPAPEEVYARVEKEFPELMKEDEKYMTEILASKTRPGEREEMRMWDSAMNQARRSDKLHVTPTTLLIAAGKAAGGQDRDPSNPMNKAWIEELEKWAKKRPNLEYRIITNSGHHMAKFQPDTVINAIRIHINQYQAKTIKQSATPYKKPDQLKDGIQTSTLTDVGIDAKLIKAMQDSITAGGYSNIHSVLILRNNKLVYENYWPGHDENRATDFAGMIDHHRDSLHDIRSITKSITSAAVMLALDQGKIKNLDQRLFDFFPEFSKYAAGRKKDITLRQLLTMTSGLNWQEERSYNDSIKKHDVSYALDFILRQPLVSEPGAKFSYNSGSTQLLAMIVEKATGMDIEKFTVKYLFEPLGIKNFEWTKEKNGLISAWAGLRMRSRDMMKFGMLYLNGGKWNGKQIIPTRLVEESMRTHIYAEEPYGYGYQFWTLVDTVQHQPVNTIEASGNGGQKIEMNRSENLVLVITAGNYDLHDLKKAPYDLYLDFVYPSLIK
jgi:CubicO group peptidase (beta-lactamase class C family)/pimeloyl-ACP methyl ester carboxylesterase